MPFIPPLIFACCVNIDAFLVGISYGLRNARITLCQNLFISLIAFAGTMFSIVSGSAVLRILPPFLTDWVGCGILLLFGCFYLLKYFLCKLGICSPPQESTLRLPLSLRATILLGFSLSCNNIGIGIGASLGGISFLPTAISTFSTSVLFLSAGNRLGHTSVFHATGICADLLSGILLILLGLYNRFL